MASSAPMPKSTSPIPSGPSSSGPAGTVVVVVEEEVVLVVEVLAGVVVVSSGSSGASDVTVVGAATAVVVGAVVPSVPPPPPPRDTTAHSTSTIATAPPRPARTLRCTAVIAIALHLRRAGGKSSGCGGKWRRTGELARQGRNPPGRGPSRWGRRA